MAYDVLGPASAPGAVTVRPSDSRAVGATDTWFADCTSDLANDGTAFQAAWFNGVLGQLRHLLRGNGNAGGNPIVAESNADDDMILKAIQHLIQRGQPKYATDSGTANSVVVSLSPAPPEYKAGMVIHVKIAANCTGATQVNVNNLGFKNVTHVDGSALIKDDVIAGQIAALEYDGTQFQLVSTGAPVARNKMFITQKSVDQSLPQGTPTDVSFNAATAAFGTFDGVTFTWAQPGTYITFSGLYIDATISQGDYIHTGGTFVKGGSGSLGNYGYGDTQVWVSTPNTIALMNWGFRVDEIAAGDTMKIQAATAATAYWTAGKVRASGQTFFAIARF